MKKELKKEARLLHTSNMMSLTSGEVKELLPYLVVVMKGPAKNSKRVVIGLDWSSDIEKDRITEKVRDYVISLGDNIRLMIFSSEMWFTKFDKDYGKDRVLQEPRPRDNPNRKEGLLTTAFTPDFRNTYTITQEMVRVKDKITFEEEVVLRNKDAEMFILERMTGLHVN